LDGDVVPINFAKIAEGYGCKSYEVKDESELKAALEDAKKQNRSTLIDIKVLPKSMSSGYDAWWRVGVAEVSESDSVREAYELMNENIKKSRLY